MPTFFQSPRLQPRVAMLALTLIAGSSLAADPAVPPGPDGAPARRMHLAPPGSVGGMYAGMVLHHAAVLGLSQEQTDTIKGFADANKAPAEQRRAAIHAQIEAVIKTRPDDANYSTVVAKAAQVVGDLTSQGIQQESQLRAQVWSVLTTAQRAKVVDLEATMKKHFDHGPPPAP